jgi:hypothetical protein
MTSSPHRKNHRIIRKTITDMTLFRITTVLSFDDKKNPGFCPYWRRIRVALNNKYEAIKLWLESKVGWIQSMVYSRLIPGNLGIIFLFDVKWDSIPTHGITIGGYYHTTIGLILLVLNDKVLFHFPSLDCRSFVLTQ